MIRVISILLALFFYSCYKAIQLRPSQPFLMVGICGLFFLTVIVTMQFGRSRPSLFDRLWFNIVTWIGFLFIGFWATFALLTIPVDILFGLYSLIVGQENFLNHDIHLGLFWAALMMVFLGFVSAVFGPRIVKVDIPLANDLADLKNFKIAQISDLHIGPTIRGRYVRKVVKRTNGLEPDLIVLTGDLVDAHTESVKRHLQPLSQLKAKYGIFYVTGNHEYYWGIQALLPELEKLGIQILMNSHHRIIVGQQSVLIAGIHDPVGEHFIKSHRPNISDAKSPSDSGSINILLSHRPDPYLAAAEHGFDLQFSGHTHAGQFFPFSLFIPFVHKFYRGLYQHDKLWIYVNPGTGYWGPANRFGIASEITLAKLV
ncbi:MAG: metallophosphoesterase [Bdellovibrionaceae bacterium]|nr:metallophosphoesterase [Pseudobdellovibrionaceae bacterium]